MPKSIKASPPTFSVRTQPDGRIIKTRLSFEDANIVAVLFNRFWKDFDGADQRAEVLREDDTVRWAGGDPVALRPKTVRRNPLGSV